MTKQQILQQFGGDEKAFYAQFPTQAHYDEYCKGGMVKKKIPIYGNGGKIPSYNFGGTTNILQQRVGDIADTKAGINKIGGIAGTIAGTGANLLFAAATGGASAGLSAGLSGGAGLSAGLSGGAGAVGGAVGGAGVAGTEGALGTFGDKVLNSDTYKFAENLNKQSGGDTNTGSINTDKGGIGDAIAAQKVGGIGGLVQKQFELYGKVGAELFGKGISDAKNKSIYAGLGQTNQAKEKYLEIENTADVYGQKPGSMMAHGGTVVGRSHKFGGVPGMTPSGPLELEGGEAVMTVEATKKFAPILSAMNQSVGGNPITPHQTSNYMPGGGVTGHPIVGTPTVDDEGSVGQYGDYPILRDSDQNEISQEEFDAMSASQRTLGIGATALWNAGVTKTPTLKPGVHQNTPLNIPGVTDVDENGYPIPQTGAVNSNGTGLKTNIPPPGFKLPNNNGSTFNENAPISPNYPYRLLPGDEFKNYYLYGDKHPDMIGFGEEPVDNTTSVNDTTQYEPRPRYGTEALGVGASVVSAIHNGLMKYHAGPKPIPMTAEEERTNRFVERNTDLANIATTDAMANASNKRSSSSGKLAAQLGVYSNSINNKMDSEAKWYGEEEAAKNRNIGLRNTVSNTNRMEANAYNQNEAANRNNFKMAKGQAFSADIDSAIQTMASFDEARVKDRTSMIQMDAYSRMVQIPQLTSQYSTSVAIRDEYKSKGGLTAFINDSIDPNRWNKEMANHPESFRPIKKKKFKTK